MASWNTLPSELKIPIFEELNTHDNKARYASVCREWRTALEKHNFRSLSLRSRDIRTLEILGKRQFDLIRYIWFSIELDERDGHSSSCQMGRAFHGNRNKIHNDLRGLMSALSKRSSTEGLTLDISISSPSDQRHHFVQQEPAFGSASRTASMIPSAKTRRPIYSCHYPSCLLTLLGGQAWNFLPLVGCVTRLLLRRQTRLQWDMENLKHLIFCFPELRELCFEPLRQWNDVRGGIEDSLMLLFLQSLILNGLKKLTLFEDLNSSYIDRYIKEHPGDMWGNLGIHNLTQELEGVPDIRITTCVAKASLGLHHLSSAFMTDARQFWEVRQPDWVWRSLLTLSLTSRDLVPWNSSKNISSMLRCGAEVVEKMPQLETIEIWNSTRKSAAVFKYKNCKPGYYAAKMEWRSSWDFSLDRSVVVAWQSVSRGSLDVEVEYKLISSTQVQNTGDAILVLGLQLEPACPISVEQLRREHIDIAKADFRYETVPAP